MSFIIVGICLFAGFALLFLVLMPGHLLQVLC